MNASFKEKSTWLSLAATLYVFADYFWGVISLTGSSISVDDKLLLLKESLTYAVFLIIIIEIIFQSALAISNRNPAEVEGDERDKSIENKASTLGYYLLSIAIIILVGHIIYPNGLLLFLNLSENAPEFSSDPAYIAHLLVSMFLTSEVIKMSYQIYLYRKDAL